MKQPIALSAFNDNYIWVIPTIKQGTFICIDPGEASPVLLYAKESGFSLSNILLTHHHHDHIGGIGELLKKFPDAVVFAPDDQRIPPPIKPVHGDDVIVIDGFSFQVFNTPGHTRSHVCYYEANQHWLFSGDTLFSAGCGRVFDGTIEELNHSLLTLRTLPDKTQLYCGHEYTRQNLRFATTIEPHNPIISDYLRALNAKEQSLSLPSTIAQEKEINPFFRIDTPALIEFAKENHIEPMDSLSIFKWLRDKKDFFQ